ncbi:MAG: adenylate/guanylate cyclase domain-containing protein [Armatimonadota bacterium]|nr:adenylate/guanylate cyclase domain-containing protein [Armatimonadota bacterium]MCX7778153.1 adenylate/guanylate cyclase domain-containing protein [Armatimonadota bacterium]MDW8024507.1 adenylate/guanylate cyclase domain-containing protein [Armatimonadota bacterium]
MSAPTMQQRYERVSVALGIVSGILVCVLYLLRLPPIPQFEDWLIKQWFLLRGELPSPDDIVIIAIDDKSIRQLGRFPWRRRTHAKLLEQLKLAKAVVIDILFVEPDRERPDDDRLLSDAIAKCGNVILPVLRLDEPHPAEANSDEWKALEMALCKLSYALPQGIDKSFMERIAAKASDAHLRLRAPITSFLVGCKGIGIAHSNPDTTGIYRQLPLGTPVECGSNEEGGLRVLPSITIEAARAALNLNREEVKFLKGGVMLGDSFVPTVGANWLMDVNFIGGRDAFYKLPYHLVYSGKVSKKEFAGKIVVVGFTAEGLYDIRPSPFSQYTYGVEILANAIHTLVHRQHFRRLPHGFIMLLALVIPVLLSWMLPRINALLALLATIASVCIVTLLCLKSFSANIIISASPVYAGIVLSYALVTSWGYFSVGREHRRMKNLFALYVSGEIAERLARYPELAAIGGEDREVSVLFADIRDFTATMQRLGAERLTKLLTEYFTVMSDVIKRHSGFVDKFIGDEIMALFGAPMPTDGYALNAVMAALEMRATAESLSKRWLERGDPQLRIGIGIATGIASVGNFGALDRFQYTAFGDPVNLASRLQALTKETGAAILICAQTARKVEGVVELKPIGKVTVRGFSEPIEVFEIVGVKSRANATSSAR